MAWIKKYAPKTVDNIIGQDEAIKQLINNISKKKSTIVYGPSGCGKTCSVQAIAQTQDAELIELNASDTRNKQGLQDILGNVIAQQSFFFSGKIILIDEIDGLSGTNDRGSVPELVRIIKSSPFPFILTCMNPYDQKFKALRKECDIIEMPPLSSTHITHILESIAKQEDLTYNIDAIKKITMRAQGDARAAINDLQLLGTQEITVQSVEELSSRAKVRTIQEALTTIFKSSEAKQSIDAFDQVPEDVDQRFLWLDYNMPREYTKPKDMARAYGALAKADVYRARIRRRQHWRFLVYVNTLLTSGITMAKDEPYRGVTSYKQTTRLLRIWQVNMSQSKKKSIAQKLATATHTSTRNVMDQVALLKHMPETYEELDLSKEEIAWLKK